MSSKFCIIRNHLCRSFFFNKVAGLRPPAFNFIKKGTLTLVFSRTFCKIFENTYFVEPPGEDCSYVFSKLFMTGNFSFCNYNVTNSFIISFISEEKEFVLRNFLNSHHIELPLLISYYIFILFSWLYVFIDMYWFIFFYVVDTYFVLWKTYNI